MHIHRLSIYSFFGNNLRCASCKKTLKVVNVDETDFQKRSLHFFARIKVYFPFVPGILLNFINFNLIDNLFSRMAITSSIFLFSLFLTYVILVIYIKSNFSFEEKSSEAVSQLNSPVAKRVIPHFTLKKMLILFGLKKGEKDLVLYSKEGEELKPRLMDYKQYVVTFKYFNDYLIYWIIFMQLVSLRDMEIKALLIWAIITIPLGFFVFCIISFTYAKYRFAFVRHNNDKN